MTRFLFAAMLVLTACGGEGGPRTITYYFTADPRSLDPAFSTDVPSGEMIAMLFDNVTQFDAAGRLVPGIATRWEADSTGATYTFHLRTDARFHDGRPITARTVRASFRRVLSLASKGSRTWTLTPIRGAAAFASGDTSDVEGLAAPDDSTLVVTLEEPLNVFPKLLAMPASAIVPESLGPDFGERPVGSGPWTFVSWSHDDALLVAANEDYWGGRPLSDSLRVRIIPEPLTQAAEYEFGQLAIVEVPFSETVRWEREHGPELQRRPALRALYVAINTRRGALQDVRVRRALNLAVDAGTMMRTIMAGRGVRSAGAIPPGIEGYDSARAPYPHDTAAARALLVEAGYAGGLTLKLWRTQRSELARIAQSIQQSLAQVGVTIEIIERDASSARAASSKGEADLFLTDWYADYPDPESFNYPTFYSKNAGGGGNRAFYADPVTDRMILRARGTPDAALKDSLSRAIDQRIFEAAPWIFLWFPVDLWAERPNVTGWEVPAIFNGQRWRTVERVP
ncbi:MAG TPA: ABC transporter substrate-binding protein [Gemmatimonadales bacterium]|jgi:ABC-type transport system substrate-binding protein|nr:ABC transporter substrate-binding protein [Gemmatimonadales bacterium]